MTESKTNKAVIVAIGILVVLALALFVCWASTQPQALESVKEITITVKHSDDFIPTSQPAETDEENNENEPYVLEFETTAKTLGEAVDGMDVLEFVPEENEMIVAAADGEYADFYHNQYWLCYFDGETLEEPLDTYPIEDGDSFYFYLISEY